MIQSETDQSGRVSHEVKRDGDDVEIVMRREGGAWLGVNVTPEHARELAKALIEASGHGPIIVKSEERGAGWSAKIEIQRSCGECYLFEAPNKCLAWPPIDVIRPAANVKSNCRHWM